MKNTPFKLNWDETKAHFVSWWNAESIGRPLLSMPQVRRDVALPGAPEFQTPRDVVEKFTNVELIVNNARHQFHHSAFLAETFPRVDAIPGVEIMALYFGGTFGFETGAPWLNHFIDDWNRFGSFELDENQPLFLKHQKDLEKAVEMADGDFLVDMPDLIEGIDILSAARGPQTLCMDLFDYPEIVKQHLAAIDRSYEKCFNRFYDIIRDEEHGNSFLSFQIWGPGKTAKLQVDFSTMLSPDMFVEYALPTLRMECDIFDYTLYHLDGKGAIPHLDSVLTLDKLNGVQWMAGAGQPDGGTELWYPLYRKVRARNKNLWIYFSDGTLKDAVRKADALVREFGSAGLFFHFWYDMGETEARELLAHAERHWK